MYMHNHIYDLICNYVYDNIYSILGQYVCLYLLEFRVHHCTPETIILYCSILLNITY
jgi:hypothetical protein